MKNKTSKIFNKTKKQFEKMSLEDQNLAIWKMTQELNNMFNEYFGKAQDIEDKFDKTLQFIDLLLVEKDIEDEY